MQKIPFVLYSIAVILFVVMSIDFYLQKSSYAPSSDAFLNNPARYTGKITEFAGAVINVSADSFYMEVNKRPLKVYFPNMIKPKLGQLYVMTELNGDGTAKALHVHPLSYNYLKYVLSFFAFIIFLFIFFREWKFRKWRFIENA